MTTLLNANPTKVSKLARSYLLASLALLYSKVTGGPLVDKGFDFCSSLCV